MGFIEICNHTGVPCQRYADWSGCDPAKAAVYKEFAKKQVDYALEAQEEAL